MLCSRGGAVVQEGWLLVQEPSKEKITSDDVLVTDEVHLRAYIDAALGGILAVNGDGRIVFMNGHTEQMFGYPRHEILGQSLMTLVPQRFRQHYMGALHDYSGAPTVRLLGMDMDLMARRKDGEEFPVEIGVSFVQGAHGTIALGLITDITERKRDRDELKRVNTALAQSNSDLEHYAHLVSHDLQEPLRVITSYLALLDRRYHTQLNAEAGHFLDFAVDGAERMKRQIEDLLNLSRMGTNALTLRFVRSETIVQRAMNNLEAAIAESSAEVSWDPMPEIFADSDMLTQVLQNLIANAIKFNKEPIPRVHVSAVVEGSNWLFSVRDNGIGIDPQQADRVFEVFERLHSATEFAGTGVGLTIARKIVERHKGKIWFASKPSEGTTFFFSIPQEAAMTA
jgi:PAS domain S-box-containing protein